MQTRPTRSQMAQRTRLYFVVIPMIIVIMLLAGIGIYKFNNYLNPSGIPKPVPFYQSGPWLKVKDIWVTNGQTAIVNGDRMQNDSVGVSLHLNDVSKYYYKQQLGNGIYDTINNGESMIAADDAGCTREVRIYDRNNNLVATIIVVVQANK